MSEAFWTKLIDQLPAILIAITSAVAAWKGIQNGKKADAAASHAEKAADGVKVADQKLNEIHQKTEEALSNTNGNLSKLQDELSRRTAREEVLERMVSELTTVLSAGRATAPASSTSIPVGRRSTDPPISVKVVEDAVKKKD